MRSLALALLGIVASSAGAAAGENVVLHAPKAVLHLEVARNEATRRHGLMFRTSLMPHTGMIFVMPTDARVDFWMKNTRVGLDMIFISEDGRVRSIAARVPASPKGLDDGLVAHRAGNARYVIELPSNEAARDGIRVGTQFSLPPSLKRPTSD